MPISLTALVMGLVLTCVGGYFSVVGLATIFSGAFWSVVVMATALETSKVIAASWIYRCWKIAPFLIRTYMVAAVITLVLITSLGIFGYLSKAHLEQTIEQGGNNEIQIEALERRIARQQGVIRDSETVLLQLDRAVQTLIDYDRIRGPSGSIAVRSSQKEERQSLNDSISDAYDEIESLNDELIPLKKTQIKLEAEIGPLKYIAEAIYGEDARTYFDTAVRWIIIVIVMVFDPLAIALILAGNIGLMNRTIEIKEEGVLKVNAQKVQKVDWDHAPHPNERDGLGLDG
jgi:hypothetical protein